MADPARARKVADRIKVVVAEYLEYRIKDERLGFITITDVRVTGDLQNATVFYTAYGSAAEQEDTGRALETARGRIRSAVGQQLGIRLTPTLAFVQDALPEGAAHLEDVLAATIAADLELAKAREGAVHAGEADPYRKPVVEEADEVDEPDELATEPAGPPEGDDR